MALHWAMMQNQKGIYTTPLKALSNEKYRDFCTIYGRSSVGLSTGDVSINKGAKVSIMTTEVYRNIAWRSSLPSESDELAETSMAILDELHYMGHPGRGGVWEESIVTTPSHTQLVGLSATLANGNDICAWMESVTQRPTVLVEVPGSKRPVPLRYLFATRDGLYPLFRDPDAGPGAPHGLLGLRGDGADVFANKSNKKKHSKNKGFGNVATELAGSMLPKGLEVNPLLTQATEKRMKKIDRAMDKQMELRRSTIVDEDSPRRHIKPRKLSKREASRERERLLKKEMRRSVPSLHALVERLRRKDLLPAIFFIFSRAGCDQAAQSVARSMMSSAGFDRLLEDGFIPDVDLEKDSRPKKRNGRQRSKRKQDLLQDQNGRSFRKDGNFVNEDILFESMMNDLDVNSGAEELLDSDGDVSVLSREKQPFYSAAGLLEPQEVQEVASAIVAFNQRNEELAFEEDVMEQLLLGLGSHVRCL